jgi:hypothetical protein
MARFASHQDARPRRPTTTGRTLFTLEYYGTDIISVTPISDASSEEVKQVKVEIYTEKMQFSYPAMELE